MTTYERRQSLLELLRKQVGIRVPELAAALDVSEGTVRNDLNALEADGHVTRVHGGAIPTDQGGYRNATFSTRHQEHSAEKALIAKHAAALVNDGDSILLDASSTVYHFALAIQDRKRLRIVTNGLEVARLMAQDPTNTVVLIGGVLNQDGSSVTGLLSERIIQELHVQKAFVSCSGFSLERGMSEVHIEEAQLKRKGIEASRQVIALIDSSKIGKDDLTPFARADQISHVITDEGISPQWAQAIERAGITLMICKVMD